MIFLFRDDGVQHGTTVCRSSFVADHSNFGDSKAG
jgi:hypothetical protein